MVAAQIALEKFRQRDRLLTTENEMFKVKNLSILAAFSCYMVAILFTVLYTVVLKFHDQTENVNHKKRVMELEAEIKKLSGQQNLQQRIHHHAKIKAR